MFRNWINGLETSLAIVPLSGDPITAIRRLRRGLRDVRDRASRQDQRWCTVAFGGLADGNRALILIRHKDIPRDEVWELLEQRWPEIILCNCGNVEPSHRMRVDQAVILAQRRRSIESIRIVVMPQGEAAADPWDEPMPMLF